MANFSIPIRVYIEDTDAGGIVFYANYLKYMERARTEWLRACGVELDEWQHKHNLLFVVRSVQIEYLLPARFNEQLTASAIPMSIKPASIICQQDIKRGEALLTQSRVRLAIVKADTLRPCIIPAPLKEAISVEL